MMLLLGCSTFHGPAAELATLMQIKFAGENASGFDNNARADGWNM
jgi:hypothetical protein